MEISNDSWMHSYVNKSSELQFWILLMVFHQLQTKYWCNFLNFLLQRKQPTLAIKYSCLHKVLVLKIILTFLVQQLSTPYWFNWLCTVCFRKGDILAILQLLITGFHSKPLLWKRYSEYDKLCSCKNANNSWL
jgi:hypothetical protein